MIILSITNYYKLLNYFLIDFLVSKFIFYLNDKIEERNNIKLIYK